MEQMKEILELLYRIDERVETLRRDTEELKENLFISSSMLSNHKARISRLEVLFIILLTGGAGGGILKLIGLY
jgi:hypothetical protein